MKMTNQQNRLALASKENSLQFCGDRVDLNEWWAILTGISQDQSLPKIHVYSRRYRKKIREPINSKEKLEKFWRRKGNKLDPVLFTNYLLRCFVDALGKNLKDSSILRILILDGIPLSIKYLEILCMGLSCNENLRTLSLARCRIADRGCSLVLESLENNINLEKLNLTSCDLTHNSGYSLSAFLKKRKQILLKNDWTESRELNTNSELQQIRGLRTLILDKNPEFSDFGLRLLVESLERDFWLRVLKLKSCGLRKKGEAILELLRTNCTITTIDFRQNNISSIISKIVKKLLRKRRKEGERLSMKKILLTKKVNFNRGRIVKEKLIKSSRRNRGNIHKNCNPKRKMEKASTPRGVCIFSSTSYFNRSTKSISRINQLKRRTINLSPRSNSESRKTKFIELKLRLSDIIDYNRRLTERLKINRELFEKEKNSRLKIEKCYEKVGPEIAKICRGILVHVDKAAKN